MSLFYFHLRLSTHILVDREGSDCPDIDSARREAVAGARQILADAIKSGAESIPEAFVITDCEGREIGILPLVSVLPKQLQHRVASLRPNAAQPPGSGLLPGHSATSR